MTPADGSAPDGANRGETTDGTGTGADDGGGTDGNGTADGTDDGADGTDTDGSETPPDGSDAARERRIREWAGDNRDRVEAYLLELVEAETPTENPETFDPFFERLAADFEAVGLETERVPGEETGGRLEAYSPGSGDEPIQLVLGHADTVWPLGTVAETPPEVRGDVLEGPGSLDMKGGLTQAVFALRALEALSLDPGLPVHVLVSSDEEVGSPESKPRIVELAKRAARVFVLEPASGPEGKIKTARKAVGHFTVTIEGKAAHAGLEPEAGASATEELGTVIHRLHDLTDVDSGVTVNVGEVEAGLRSNVVAPEARAEVDVRAPTEAAADGADAGQPTALGARPSRRSPPGPRPRGDPLGRGQRRQRRQPARPDDRRVRRGRRRRPPDLRVRPPGRAGRPDRHAGGLSVHRPARWG